MKKRVYEAIGGLLSVLLLSSFASAFTINLVNDQGEDFSLIEIGLYQGENKLFFTVSSDPILKELYDEVILGKEDDGTGTVCDASCLLTIDSPKIKLSPGPFDLEVIVRDKTGFTLFYKKVNDPNQIELHTKTTREIKTVKELEKIILSKGITIGKPDFVIDSYIFEQADDAIFSLKADADSNLLNSHEILLRYWGETADDESFYAETTLESPFEEVEDGKVTVTTDFIRGDANSDGNIDITDAVYTLNYLFMGGLSPPCEDAADTDDSGKIDISDTILILNYLFTGGSPPKDLYVIDGEIIPIADQTSDNLKTCTEEYS